MLAWERERGEPMERVFAEAIERAGGNVSAAADSVGMSRETFRWWVLRLGLELEVRVVLPEAV
jgi:DNA-binding NtrC family response regulator